MYIEQLYTSCLAEAAYYIESAGEAVVIDPLRDIDPFITLAEKRQATIKYVLETHFHADFVSGHLELARQTGAKIVFGADANPGFDHLEMKDGDEITVGQCRIRALHTPGHTLESTTYLLFDENGKEHAIFSGDTLFIGDVGRPDLAVKSDLNERDLAALLYRSLCEKIMPLPDEVIVYPAHGQGSACGKNMSAERFDTLGNQKQLNYALQADLSESDFVDIVSNGLSAAPQYFPKNVMLNKGGYHPLPEILQRGSQALSPAEFKDRAGLAGTLILDTRSAADFASAHIPQSLFIGIDGQFAPWVGTLIEDLNTPILLVAYPERVEEVITRLARVGYDNSLGYLAGGMESWQAAGFPTEKLQEMQAEELEARYEEVSDKLIDVRRPGEYANLHLRDVPNLPLDDIQQNQNYYQADNTYILHCAGGYRSVIAASWLRRKGISRIINVPGGFAAIRKTQAPMALADTVA